MNPFAKHRIGSWGCPWVLWLNTDALILWPYCWENCSVEWSKSINNTFQHAFSRIHSPTELMATAHQLHLSESKSSAEGCLCLWTTSVENLLQFNERKDWKEREVVAAWARSPRTKWGFYINVWRVGGWGAGAQWEVKKPQEEEEAQGNWMSAFWVTGGIYRLWKCSFYLKTGAPAW